VKFELDDITTAVREEMASKADARLARIGQLGPHDTATWKAIADFGLLTGDADGLRSVDVVAGMMALARGGLPGPVLEAALAVASGSSAAEAAVRSGELVTSIGPGPRGPEIAGWAAAAALVIDQRTGLTLSEGPSDLVATALPMEHGWVDRPDVEGDPLQSLRWLYGAALSVGLGFGELQLATEHVKSRTQFGRPLGSFQAVQFRLAEAVVKLEAGELMVLDAARRRDAGDPFAPIAAALAWVYMTAVSEFVEKQTIQVMGAIAFTTEAGLIRFTYQSAWLRTSIGVRAAKEAVMTSRDVSASPPLSTIPPGFAV